MAKKHDLRVSRAGTVINVTSKMQETEVIRALHQVVATLTAKFGAAISLEHQHQWFLKDIVAELRHSFRELEFHCHFENSCIRPDGGILLLRGKEGDKLSYPILIAEVKNQGTNDLRAREGLLKQAKGNAIERLGKNLIGLRTALMRESIFPFVCFGYGCDFAPDSSILDRITTMAMFGKLNKTYLHGDKTGRFNRGSFYFREKRWSVNEMAQIMNEIAVRSVQYYSSRYGESHFAPQR
jgi:type II restriction enzyme